MKNTMINKVQMTNEAKLDYQMIFDSPIPYSLKLELENYLTSMNLYEHFNDSQHFRCICYDTLHQVDLMFFINKGYCFRTMQLWNVIGICKAIDWNESLENSGLIEKWLMTKIDDLSAELDM